MNNFDKAVAHILEAEGGYVNDPNDPGGETNFGICKRQYPDLDIKNLTKAEASAIYKRDYWDNVKGDKLPWPLALFVFDAAVNQGVDAAVKTLQKTLRVPQDGILGLQTLKAAQNSSVTTEAFYLADRALRYTGTRNFDKYGRGWLQRIFKIAILAEGD